MRDAVTWAKSHKAFTLVILLIIGWMAWPRVSYFLTYNLGISTRSTNFAYESYGGLGAPSVGNKYAADDFTSSYAEAELYPEPPIEPDYPPVEGGERVIIRDASMAMVVDDVSETLEKVTDHATSLGGYMVNSNLTRPTDTPYATITIRVPSEQLDAVVNYYRSLAVKITSESISGRDVTDEFEDIDEHIRQLDITKTQLEDIRNKATEIEDLLNVTNQITNIQRQIDSFKGRQKYITQNSKLSRITLTLSSDELALPYTPDETFRPAVIFRQAVRSLYSTLREAGEFLIWVGVYAAIWVPALIIIWWWRKRSKKPLPPGNTTE